MCACVCVHTHTHMKYKLKVLWDLLAKYLVIAFVKAVWMRIAFDFVLKRLLVEKKSVKSLRRNHSVPQRPRITYGKVKSNGEATEKLPSLLPSFCSNRFLHLPSLNCFLYSKFATYWEVTCSLSYKQWALCTICSNLNNNEKCFLGITF